MSLPLAQDQRYLLSEESGSQGVQDRVQGTVDRQDEDHHPGCDGSLKRKRESDKITNKQTCMFKKKNKYIL